MWEDAVETVSELSPRLMTALRVTDFSDFLSWGKPWCDGNGLEASRAIHMVLYVAINRLID